MNMWKNVGKLVLGLAVTIGMAAATSTDALAADTGTVAGKVMGKDGTGLAGAKVMLMKPGEGGGKKGKKNRDAAPAAAQDEGKKGKGERPKPVADTTSGADGAFRLENVPAGDYMLVARARGEGNAREKVSVKAGDTTTVELKLAQGGGKKKGKGKKDGE